MQEVEQCMEQWSRRESSLFSYLKANKPDTLFTNPVKIKCPSFPRKRESSGKSRTEIQFVRDHLNLRPIPGSCGSRIDWIPACAGMTW
jgi:hypothetical protein